MNKIWRTFHKIGELLHLPDLPNWLIGLLTLIIVLRIPTFFEPYNYGDEMIYLTLGQGIRQGIPLYSGIYDNKPPLLYLTAALAGNLFWFKAALALFNLLSIIIFFKITEAVFNKKYNFQKLATFIFAIFTTIPLFEGVTANAENFMMLPVLLAFYILLAKNNNKINLLFSGILFGIAALYKIPASFELPVILVYWLIISDFEIKTIKIIIKKYFLVAIGFLIPIIISFIWFYLQGDLNSYIKAAFLQNIGYISSFRPGDANKPFIIRNAPLLIRAAIVLAGLILLWFFHKKTNKQFVLMSTWVLFALFAITLSERPYPHYLLQAIAPISLLLANLFTDKTINQTFSIIPLAIAFFVPFYYKFWIYPVTPYYVRFINFASGKISRQDYFSNFSSTTPRNYEIADFLSKSTTTDQKVFVWDPDAPAIYALSRRLPPLKFVVPYHINDYSNIDELIDQINKNQPKIIIITSFQPIPQLLEIIKKDYILINQIDNAEIFSKVYNSSNDIKQ